MLVAVAGAAALGDYTEAGAVVFLFTTAEWLETLTVTCRIVTVSTRIRIGYVSRYGYGGSATYRCFVGYRCRRLSWRLGRRSMASSPAAGPWRASAPTSSIWSCRYLCSSAARCPSPSSTSSVDRSPPPTQHLPLAAIIILRRRRRKRTTATATQSSGSQRSTRGRRTGSRHSHRQADRHAGAGAWRRAPPMHRSEAPPAGLA
uniref:Uncharacterized protein n=1 Tax=Arundo donax TaxID=35708 RepID=A0A0A8YIF9_ARUDO